MRHSPSDRDRLTDCPCISCDRFGDRWRNAITRLEPERQRMCRREEEKQDDEDGGEHGGHTGHRMDLRETVGHVLVGGGRGRRRSQGKIRV